MEIPAWVFFALLHGFLLSIVNLFDKFILNRWVKDPVVPVILLGFIGLIFAGGVFLLQPVPLLSAWKYVIASAAGCAMFLVAFFYFHAAKIEEISRVVPWFFLSPLFVAVMASFFLGEIFGWKKYFGIALLLGGAMLISKRGKIRFRMERPYILMLLSALSMSVYLVIVKFMLQFMDYWILFAFTRLGLFLVLIPVTIRNWPKLTEAVKDSQGKILWAIGSAESIALFGSLSLVIAASTGYVTLVNALASVQPFFVLLFSIILSRFFPHIIREEIQGKTILFKAAAVAMMFAGAVLVT